MKSPHHLVRIHVLDGLQSALPFSPHVLIVCIMSFSPYADYVPIMRTIMRTIARTMVRTIVRTIVQTIVRTIVRTIVQTIVQTIVLNIV